jgi:hypothetical protein
VLARDRVVFLDLHLVGRRALVLGRGVEMAGAGGGLELDLLTHGSTPVKSEWTGFTRFTGLKRKQSGTGRGLKTC